MTTNSITGIRHNIATPNEHLYQIVMPNGDLYTDLNSNENIWPRYVAIAIARNISMKRKCVTTLRRFTVEEVVTPNSSYDRVLNYVDSLKGQALRWALMDHNLSRGSDPVASKRERLIAHLLKCKCSS